MALFRTTKQTGDIGEDAAARYLCRQGCRVIARNYRTPHGEIDIIAQKGEYIIFAEVKTRQERDGGRYGRPADAVDRRKRERLRYSAACYLHENPTDKKQRIDIIEVYKKESQGRMVITDIKHFPGAVGGVG